MKTYDLPRQNGFDALRWGAALTIVVSHFSGLTQWQGMPMMPTRQAVQLFFILSGMLTYRSYLANPKPRAFYQRRARRILPAYWGTIVFCFLVGMLFTEMPLRSFLCHEQTGWYLFWNALMLNWLQPSLPATFSDHVLPVMDGSLWTMKYEVAFYVLLPLMVLLIKKNSPKRRMVTLLIAYALLVGLQFSMIVLAYHTHSSGIALLCKVGASQIVCFLSGIIVWELYPWLQHKVAWLLPATLIVAVLGFVWSPFNIVWPLAFAVLIVYAGTRISSLEHSRRLPNISYELFLIHFPIVQIVVEMQLPERLGHAAAFSITLAISLLLAYLLHRLVKPISNNK